MATKTKKTNSEVETIDSDVSGAKQASVSRNNKTKKAEEPDTSMTAVVIAIVAILFIVGTIGAFYLFVRVKKNYIEPFLKNQAGTTLPTSSLPPAGSGLGSGNATIPAGTEPLGIGDTSVGLADLTTPATIPDETEEPVDIPPIEIPEVPEIPEPEKVGSYDFEGVIAEMDGSMNSANDATLNNTIYSNDYFGFD